jgi:hypothetical protein
MDTLMKDLARLQGLLIYRMHAIQFEINEVHRVIYEARNVLRSSVVLEPEEYDRLIAPFADVCDGCDAARARAFTRDAGAGGGAGAGFADAASDAGRAGGSGGARSAWRRGGRSRSASVERSD